MGQENRGTFSLTFPAIASPILPIMFAKEGSSCRAIYLSDRDKDVVILAQSFLTD